MPAESESKFTSARPQRSFPLCLSKLHSLEFFSLAGVFSVSECLLALGSARQSTMPSTHPLVITSDEVNCLIYAYLEDSGFQHSSFSLRSEARLDLSPHSKTRVRRGELVDLLTKALLYTEVEIHWKQDTRGCTSPFTLLSKHECKTNAGLPLPMSVPPPRHEILPPTSAANGAEKRKAAHQIHDERSEKRARTHEPDNRVAMEGQGVQETAVMSLDKEPRYVQLEKESVVLLSGHKGEVFTSSWHPRRSDVLATGSKDALAIIWNIPDNARNSSILHALDHTPDESQPDFVPIPSTADNQHDITSIDWSPDCTRIATGSYDSIVRVWSATGKEIFTSRAQKDPIFKVKFSPSGIFLLSCSLDATTLVYDMETMTVKQAFKFHSACCLDVDWLDDENFASCGADGRIFICTLGNPNPTTTFDGHQDEVNQVRFTASGHMLASCSDDATAAIWWLGTKVEREPGQPPQWDPIKQGRLWSLTGHEKEVSNCRWCPIGPNSDSEKLLATSSFDSSARLWDARMGSCIQKFECHTGQIFSLDWHHSGTYFATAASDGYLCVYSVAKKELVCRWKDESASKIGLYEVEFHRSGKKLAVCLASGAVGIVDLEKLIQATRLRREVGAF